MFHEDKDVRMIAAELKSLSDWEELSGWLVESTVFIKENCLATTTAVAECCRRELVRTYCDMSSVSPQQVAENMADVLDNKMKNKRIAKALRRLHFTTSKVYSDGTLVCLESFRIANQPTQVIHVCMFLDSGNKQENCEPEDGVMSIIISLRAEVLTIFAFIISIRLLRKCKYRHEFLHQNTTL